MNGIRMYGAMTPFLEIMTFLITKGDDFEKEFVNILLLL
jgi:hypothetical protein